MAIGRGGRIATASSQRLRQIDSINGLADPLGLSICSTAGVPITPDDLPDDLAALKRIGTGLAVVLFCYQTAARCTVPVDGVA